MSSLSSLRYLENYLENLETLFRSPVPTRICASITVCLVVVCYFFFRFWLLLFCATDATPACVQISDALLTQMNVEHARRRCDRDSQDARQIYSRRWPSSPPSAQRDKRTLLSQSAWPFVLFDCFFFTLQPPMVRNCGKPTRIAAACKSRAPS